MENSCKIKDLYISPEFVTEKTLNEDLFSRRDDRNFGSSGQSEGNFSQNYDGLGNSRQEIKTDDISSPETKSTNGAVDDAPYYGEKQPYCKQNMGGEKPNKESTSKEYAAWEQYSKYLEKHNKYAGLAKK